jgi:small-conductance mechanosensitive channel
MAELIQAAESLFARPIVAASLRVLLMVLVAALALQLTSRLAARADRVIVERGELRPAEGVKRRRTMTNVVKYSINTLIILVAVISILHETGLDIQPLLAGAGIAGIVIGLGTQNLMRDTLAGLFVLMEHQYDVDDWITIAGVTGRVENVTLRMTQLRDIDGNVHFVPNGQAAVVTNLTKEWARATLDVGVAYKEDVDRVIEVLKDIGREMEADPAWSEYLLESVEVPGVQHLGESSVEIRVFFKTLPDEKWKVARELRRRIKNRFDVEGIEIPFPHRTIYLGTGDTGFLRVEQARSEADSSSRD